ncbi:MAG: efflux RND transporter periplasmic adaptor subunit [Cyanosarcina radialis HA8281-LM2]|jgi:RND family efflux transporter MFP subunit|nr:efflux RND transporter periplasmic adaptor subunit [Cyanosarcina radialis HA8281-LM2]
MPHPESPESPVSEETEQLPDDRQPKTDKLLLDGEPESDVDLQDEFLVDKQPKPPTKKRRWPLLLALAIAILGGAGAGWYWWQSSQTQNSAQAPGGPGAGQPQALPVKLATVETAEVRDATQLVGTLDAPRASVIKPEIDGRVSQLLVSEGDRVQPGQVLLQLESQDLQAQLQQSQAGLQQSLARLSELQAGSRAEEIAQAQARLAQAQANLAEAQAGSRPEEIAQARARLAQAQANLAEARAGSRSEEIAQARARLAQAQANREQVQNNRPEQLRQAQARVDSTQAQAALTEVRAQRYRGLRQQGAIAQDRLDEAEADNKTAQANLEEARRNLQQVQNSTQQDIAQRQAAVTEAQQALRQLQNGTRPEVIAQRQAAAAEAQQALRQLQNGTRPEVIAQRQAAVAEAQQALRQLQNGTRPEAIAQARSQVAQASAQVKAAEVQLQKTRVVAPFAGTVGDIPIKTGDFVSQGDELTTITRNDFLELNIPVPLNRSSELRLGLPVEVLDTQGKAIATGQVSFIAPNVDANSQTVLAKASFANAGRALLNRQFVPARIIWNERSGIVIPVNAVSRLGGQTFVFVAERSTESQSGQPQLVARQKPVKLGEIQGNNYQVLEGLQPGQEIVTAGVLNLTDGAAIAPDSGGSPSQ